MTQNLYLCSGDSLGVATEATRWSSYTFPILFFNCDLNCKIMPNYRLTQEEVIARFKKRHGDKYDYSLVEYKGYDSHIKVICPIHGVWEVEAGNHLRGGKCPQCCRDAQRKTTESFITEAKEIWGSRYDYSEVKYINAHKRVCIICHEKDKNGNEHGRFYQIARDHLRGHGCKKCKLQHQSEWQTKTNEKFVDEMEGLYQGKGYDFSITEYKKCGEPVRFVCSKHGIVEMTPTRLLSGYGCPRCASSRGENRVSKWLASHNIEYLQHYKITPLQYSLFGRLYFVVDFLLPTLHTIIEYNGEQHYKRIEAWHTEEEFQEQQDRDRRLRKHCRQNGIKLIEIPYTKFNEIDKILDKKIRLPE